MVNDLPADDEQSRLCLHFGPEGAVPSLEFETALLHLVRERGLTAELAQYGVEHRTLFGPLTSVDWLQRTSGISRDEATRWIEAIRPHVSRVETIYARNPGNPKGFLRVAAALARRPDVLVYSTVGMDSCGTANLHAFVAEHVAESIHVRWQMTNGEQRPARGCPAGAECVDVPRWAR